MPASVDWSSLYMKMPNIPTFQQSCVNNIGWQLLQLITQSRHLEVEVRDSRQQVKYLKKISRIQQREAVASEKYAAVFLFLSYFIVIQPWVLRVYKLIFVVCIFHVWTESFCSIFVLIQRNIFPLYSVFLLRLISMLLKFARRSHHTLKDHGLATVEAVNEFTSLQRLLRGSSEVVWEDCSDRRTPAETNGVSFEQLLQFPTLGYRLTRIYFHSFRD